MLPDLTKQRQHTNIMIFQRAGFIIKEHFIRIWRWILSKFIIKLGFTMSILSGRLLKAWISTKKRCYRYTQVCYSKLLISLQQHYLEHCYTNHVRDICKKTMNEWRQGDDATKMGVVLEFLSWSRRRRELRQFNL